MLGVCGYDCINSFSSGCYWRGKKCEFVCSCCARSFAREMFTARHVNLVVTDKMSRAELQGFSYRGITILVRLIYAVKCILCAI